MSAPLGWLGLLLLMAVSALVVLGLCRAAGRAERDAEKAEAEAFAEQVAEDLAFTTITQHINEEPTP